MGVKRASTFAQVVLVNGSTASTSEMLSGALKAQKATLIGERTQGKGRAQNIIELPGGALLFISMIQYVAANGEMIDQVGLKPDIACKLQAVGEERYVGGEVRGDIDFRADPCVDLAAKQLSKQVA